jgi:hypothetical protein
MIMKRLIAALSLVATPALADFECTIERQCGGGACEAFAGGPLILHEAGDIWQASMDGAMWEGYAASTVEDGGEIAIVIPPQQGLSGLISVYPSGEVSFTVHAYGDIAVAITGQGNCIAGGG